MNTVWQQGYYIWGQNLAVSAAIAAIPVFVLLFLLGVQRKPAWIAGLAGLGATLVIALGGYHMPVLLTFSSAAYGAAFGLFPISWIVIWAIVLYNVTVETGKFAIIKDSIGSLTPDLRVQAIMIAFAFGAFIEGAAGFGTPVAVAGAMMVGLGFSPYYAAALCLLANTAPVAFGSIGLPVITLAGITGLPLDKLSGAVGTLCAPISLILPAYMILTMGGLGCTIEVWPALLVAGVTFAGVQFVVSNYIGVQLTVILSSIVAMGALVLLLRVWQPKAKAAKKVIKGAEAGEAGPFELCAPVSADPVHTATRQPGQVLAGWMPYIFLVLLVLLWGFKPFQSILNVATFPIRWPALHNLVLRTPPVLKTASPVSRHFQSQPVIRFRNSVHVRELAGGSLPENAARRVCQGRHGVGASTGISHPHHLRCSLHGLRHELLRSDRHSGTRLRRNRRCFSVLQPFPRLARRVPDGLRYLFKCAFRKPASRDRREAWI